MIIDGSFAPKVLFNSLVNHTDINIHGFAYKDFILS